LCPNGVSDGSHHSLDSAVAESHHTKGEPRFFPPETQSDTVDLFCPTKISSGVFGTPPAR
jgi:hypothetical protein